MNADVVSRSDFCFKLLVAALLHEVVTARLLAPKNGAETDPYRRLNLSDCPRRDVSPQPACGGNRNLSVAVLEACCDSTHGCGGFNTHGVIKDTDCAAHVSSQTTTDLYLKPAQPTPPPTPPLPTPLYVPQSMPWPFPNDAQMKTGATTVQLSHDFAISRRATSTSLIRS